MLPNTATGGAQHACLLLSIVDIIIKLVMLTSILGVFEGSRCGLNDPRKRVILPWYLVTGDAARSNDRNLELPLSV